MFTNVGRKIKVYAKIAFWIEAIIFVVCGIVVLVEAYWAEEVALGIGLIIGGPLTAWIMSLFIYGSGEMIEKICNIEKKIADTPEQKSKVEAFVDNVNARVEGVFKKSATSPVQPNSVQSVEIKTCPSCGAALANDAAFCTKCGKALSHNEMS